MKELPACVNLLPATLYCQLFARREHNDDSSMTCKIAARTTLQRNKNWRNNLISLRKQPFRETSPAARNEEKRLFSQAKIWLDLIEHVRYFVCLTDTWIKATGLQKAILDDVLLSFLIGLPNCLESLHPGQVRFMFV